MKYIRVLIVASALVMSTALSVSAVVTREQEPNNTPEQANPVRLGNGVIGSALGDDVDYFSIETPEHLARYQVDVHIYTPHPPLGCTVTVAVRGDTGPNQILYEGVATEYNLDWTGLCAQYYIGISSDCSELRYQLDFSRISLPHYAYLPVVRRRVGGW